jgi:hypothetical protein
MQCACKSLFELTGNEPDTYERTALTRPRAKHSEDDAEEMPPGRQGPKADHGDE